MLLSPTFAKQREILNAIDDPARFARVWLGQDLWAKQCDILQSLATHRRTAVKGCHAAGKTVAAAAAVLWWITSRQDGVAVVTAPTQAQVERQLWERVRNTGYHANIDYPKPTATELRLGP